MKYELINAVTNVITIIKNTNSVIMTLAIMFLIILTLIIRLNITSK